MKKNTKILKKDTKRLLIFCVTNIAATALLILGAKKCCNDDAAEAGRDALSEVTEIASQSERNQETTLGLLNGSLHKADSLGKEIDARNTIIMDLRDSLANCKKRKCGGKGSGNKPGRGSTESSGSAGTVGAPKDTTANAYGSSATGSTTVVIGAGAHDNIVNVNNGTINNYYGVVDTVRNAKKIVVYTVDKCYTGRRVRCR